MFDPFEAVRKLNQERDAQQPTLPGLPPPPQFDPEVDLGPYAPRSTDQPVGVEPGVAGPYTPVGVKPASGNIVPLGVGNYKADASLAAAFKVAQGYAGVPITLSSAFRDHDEQVQLYNSKPGIAAKPGTSLHEQGLALDVGNYNDPRVRDALTRAGFRQFNPKKEPWHFSYGPKVG